MGLEELYDAAHDAITRVLLQEVAGIIDLETLGPRKDALPRMQNGRAEHRVTHPPYQQYGGRGKLRETALDPLHLFE